ncbi:hypothetical protein RR46_08779 [Papilio xuthus]|uniref:Uncharacterized protein n=1 Tax=Papilio xuthus TaxID=66420 RepID=A0A194PW11_PAPXU|nr:hypothetical protein RR46_08779 [Papilio xuthus]
MNAMTPHTSVPGQRARTRARRSHPAPNALDRFGADQTVRDRVEPVSGSIFSIRVFKRDVFTYNVACCQKTSAHAHAYTGTCLPRRSAPFTSPATTQHGVYTTTRPQLNNAKSIILLKVRYCKLNIQQPVFWCVGSRGALADETRPSVSYRLSETLGEPCELERVLNKRFVFSVSGE